ncbi:MAG: T9SS type A sorting domain-containing protein [Flavobacteriaceae bacterium]|jgi:hypothetical protein|nr:T9SS type A sorting domain-containing protein [Flavobacteriaceae bacterium]
MRNFLFITFYLVATLGYTQHNIIFTVDMTGSGIDTSNGVYIAGSLNAWSGNSNALSDNGDGTWTGTLVLNDGYYEYKFITKDWANQEAFTKGDVCTTTNSGNTNRTIIVNGATTVPTSKWNSCAETESNPGPHDLTLTVDMSGYGDLTGKTVYTSGEFNTWSGESNPLTNNGDGTWTVTMTGLAEKTYQFKFTINNWAEQEDFSSISTGTEYIAVDPNGTNRYVQLSDSKSITTTWNAQTQTLSIQNNILENSFEMYPNPVNDVLKFNSSVSINSIHIFDLLGRNVKTKVVDSMSGSVGLDLNSGVYVVQIKSRNSTLFKKIVVK